jgi:hypothetical protein
MNKQHQNHDLSPRPLTNDEKADQFFAYVGWRSAVTKFVGKFMFGDGMFPDFPCSEEADIDIQKVKDRLVESHAKGNVVDPEKLSAFPQKLWWEIQRFCGATLIRFRHALDAKDAAAMMQLYIEAFQMLLDVAYRCKESVNAEGLALAVHSAMMTMRRAGLPLPDNVPTDEEMSNRLAFSHSEHLRRHLAKTMPAMDTPGPQSTAGTSGDEANKITNATAAKVLRVHRNKIPIYIGNGKLKKTETHGIDPLSLIEFAAKKSLDLEGRDGPLPDLENEPEKLRKEAGKGHLRDRKCSACGNVQTKADLLCPKCHEMTNRIERGR